MATFDPLRTAADAQIDQLIEVHRDRIATLGLERAEDALVTDVMATPDTALEALVGRYVLMANRLASIRAQEATSETGAVRWIQPGEIALPTRGCCEAGAVAFPEPCPWHKPVPYATGEPAQDAVRGTADPGEDEETPDAPRGAEAVLPCSRCGSNPPMNPSDRYADGTPSNFARYCAECIDRCHESTDFAHECPVCAGPPRTPTDATGATP